MTSTKSGGELDLAAMPLKPPVVPTASPLSVTAGPSPEAHLGCLLTFQERVYGSEILKVQWTKNI